MKAGLRMTFAVGVLAAVAGVSTAIGDPKAGDTPDKVTAELLAIEAQLADAIVKNDPVAIGRFLDDDWMIIDSDGGSVDKARFLAVIASGALTHMKMETRDPRVRVYGNSAVVTDRAITTGKYKGDLFTTDERASDFLVKKNGQWKFVFSQLTRVGGAQ
jgi:ketosteroid isomerase-like protein